MSLISEILRLTPSIIEQDISPLLRKEAAVTVLRLGEKLKGPAVEGFAETSRLDQKRLRALLGETKLGNDFIHIPDTGTAVVGPGKIHFATKDGAILRATEQTIAAELNDGTKIFSNSTEILMATTQSGKQISLYAGKASIDGTPVHLADYGTLPVDSNVLVHRDKGRDTVSFLGQHLTLSNHRMMRIEHYPDKLNIGKPLPDDDDAVVLEKLFNRVTLNTRGLEIDTSQGIDLSPHQFYPNRTFPDSHFSAKRGFIPEFDNHGYLPKGLYNVNFEQFRKRFAFNESRADQISNALIPLHSLQKMGVKRVEVGGSFVTAKPNPNDIDIAWLQELGVDEERVRKYTAPWLREAQHQYGVDLYSGSHYWKVHDKTHRELLRFNRNQKPVGVLSIDLTQRLPLMKSS